jgi:hypothetical protein
MKISLTLSLLILAIGASLSWHGSQRLAGVRENRTKLVAEAASLGIFPDPSRRKDPDRTSKHNRENKGATAKAFLAEFAAFIKEMEASGKTLDSLDEADMERVKEITASVSSLDPGQLKILVTEVCAAKNLKDEERNWIVASAMRLLADDQPETVLALFTELPDLLNKGNSMRSDLVSTSLTKWATADPMAAFEWVRKNAEKSPHLITDHAKECMMSSIATNNPKLAFKLFGELVLKDNWQALCGMACAAKTPENRMVTLTAIREYLATLPEDQGTRELIGRFAGAIAREGFASASPWFAGADFTPTELESVVDTLSYTIKPDETGQWLEWFGEKLPAEKSSAHIRETVSKWTRDDYQAAGKWLASTPAGPTKNAAVRSYAETVSTTDPATATQWAMTLPPGPDREKTLKHIQENSPAK